MGQLTLLFTQSRAWVISKNAISSWVNANGVTFLIKGYGKLRRLLQTRTVDWIEVILTNVAYIPSINYHTLSLNSVTDKGHEYVGRRDVIIVCSAGGGEIYFRHADGYLLSVDTGWITYKHLFTHTT